MLKISLFEKLCVPLYKLINTHSYRKNQGYPIDRYVISDLKHWFSQKLEPCFSYAVSRHTFEIIRIDLKRGRLTDRNDTHYCELLTEKIFKGRYTGFGAPSMSEELKPIWEKRELCLFFLPPYNSNLNIAETFWQKLKEKWLSLADYGPTNSRPTNSLLYTTNRVLAAVGSELYINFSQAT